MRVQFESNGEWVDIAELNEICLGADEYKPDFSIGDVVSLIVGGPDMVVIGMCECGTVEVAWADSDGDVCVDVFPEEALVHVDA